ncbi:MAG: hypothetical protein IKR78_01430 [Dehalococcoidales bacterium]|nr:hypothetical protein [Dehalococcoidales bacterium]
MTRSIWAARSSIALSLLIAVISAICGCSQSAPSTVTVTHTVFSTETITNTETEVSVTTIDNTVTQMITTTVYSPVTVTTTTTMNEQKDESIVYAKIGQEKLTIKLAENSSAEAFYDLLSKGDLTVDMHHYGNFEIVGDIGTTLPRNDTSITTEPGDVILYQGTSITIYYGTNSWSFTRLGKVHGLDQQQLKEKIGNSDVRVTFSLS